MPADFEDRPDEQEREVLLALGNIANASGTCLLALRQAQPLLELLAGHYRPALELAAAVLVAQTVERGTPASIAALASAALRDLAPAVESPDAAPAGRLWPPTRGAGEAVRWRTE